MEFNYLMVPDITVPFQEKEWQMISLYLYAEPAQL